MAKSEAMSERTERRVKRTGCAVKEPKVTAFFECVSGSCRCYELLP